jgi:hypothetical protein
VSVKLFKALRICEAATLVEVFSKACIDRRETLGLDNVDGGKVLGAEECVEG